MPNVMAHPAIGEELALEEAFVARFEDEEEDAWDADREEGWEEEDDLEEEDDWDDEDEWDDDEDEWDEEEGWDEDEEAGDDDF
ncbi:MAG TPA: hypothetical protein VFJ82_25930 [Longimicrobium sp.]|nr:hypothetical protein [Longimicrobium sp.]